MRTFPTADSPARVSTRYYSNQGIRRNIPSSTSLNCANLEPPGRPPCCCGLADMLEKEQRAIGGAASTGGRVAGAEEEDLDYVERSGRQMAWVAGWMGER